MSNTSLLGSYGAQDSSSLMFRNLFINGGFDVWQRGGSLGPFTNDQYVSDRWRITKNDTVNYTVNLGVFTLGQTDVPDNPRFFHRLVVNSIGSAIDYASTSQRIEDVTRLAGRVVSLSFWAKADQALTINPPAGTGLGAITVIQNFGTSGSPSVQVATIVQQSQALTTTWTKYTYTFTIPLISGKTLGTDANSSYTQISILPATAGMGGRTIDISNAQIEFGPTATPFERRPIGVELALCQRYFLKQNVPVFQNCVYFSGAFQNIGSTQTVFPTVMRDIPTVAVSYTNDDNTASVAISGLNNSRTAQGIRYAFTVSNLVFPYAGFLITSAVSAEL